MESYAGMKRVPTPGRGVNFGLARLSLEEAGEWIVRLYDEWGKTEKASEWRDQLQADKSSAPAKFAPIAPRTGQRRDSAGP